MPTSHGRLVRLPNLPPLLAATAIARLAGHMMQVTIVFHALTAFGSPMVAGWHSPRWRRVW